MPVQPVGTAHLLAFYGAVGTPRGVSESASALLAAQVQAQLRRRLEEAAAAQAHGFVKELAAARGRTVRQRGEPSERRRGGRDSPRDGELDYLI